MVEHGFAISPGTESFFSVSPNVIHADEAIHGIHKDKRRCYLKDERELLFFRHYSVINCFLECVANYTFKVSSQTVASGPRK